MPGLSRQIAAADAVIDALVVHGLYWQTLIPPPSLSPAGKCSLSSTLFIAIFA
jgi:hypothetical protein